MMSLTFIEQLGLRLSKKKERVFWTSKHAIISPSTRPDADVDYTFGQVSFETAFVDYRGNCGNISSAVGPFSIDEGLVAAVEPMTTVGINMTNSNKILVA